MLQEQEKTNKKPIILIPAWSLGDNSFGVQKTYLEYFSKFGQVEIATPNEDIRNDIDLVVLPGGQDVQSTHYNAVPGYMNSLSDPFKDYFFKNNLPKYIKAGVPVMGICLGMQQLAVHFGLPLIQNISPFHDYSSDGDKLVNKVKANTKAIFELNPDIHIKYIPTAVNSFHHQGVNARLIEAHPELDLLLSEKDACWDRVNGTYTIAEAFAHKTLPIIGVQYHPEKASSDYFTDMLVESLIYRSPNLIVEQNKLQTKTA